MYGFKGGDASQVQYPTVDSVRKEFYDTYPGSLDCEYEMGEIPIVGNSTFRLNGKMMHNLNDDIIHFVFSRRL